VCLKGEVLMDLQKSLWPQPLMERVEGVVSGDFMAADTDRFALDSDLGQLLPEFPIR
jgi:hypothetical protein